MRERADIVIVGAGAAGLMAGISAGRALHARGVRGRVVALDGAKKLGAKILVAGGGRCNVTHDVVDERAYAGSSGAAVRRVLLGFDVERTIGFFREIGVELKREETGKLFPVSDDGHTVLAALLGEAARVGVELVHPARVVGVSRVGESFEVEAECGVVEGVRVLERGGGERDTGGTSVPRGGGRLVIGARAVVIATGGMALPRSGSDGSGYALVRGLGHTVSERVFPALVPLTMEKGHWLCGLSGVSSEVAVELRSGTGKKLAEFEGAMLLTHFGVSGPVVLDISRYYLDEKARDPGCRLVVRWVRGETLDSVDRWLLEDTSRGAAKVVSERVAERLARALCERAGAEGTIGQLSRETRRKLAGLLVATELDVTGDRGFTYAEVTAGGVGLREVHLARMESRVSPGLFLCGEILDVDGRIGGYNFQWAWSSGFLAGVGAAATVGG